MCSVSVKIRPVKKKILFICVQNSARSQIAAALLNEIAVITSKPRAPDWNPAFSILWR